MTDELNVERSFDDLEESLEQGLNGLGDDGWELVSANIQQIDGSLRVIYHLKRART